ncbi:hypothetical protein BN2537_3665 [Streptomyces venezuelae]|nr:hypothetical protein BN2537_3665 [Streptomyces venezuelae]
MLAPDDHPATPLPVHGVLPPQDAGQLIGRLPELHVHPTPLFLSPDTNSRRL